MAPTTGMQKADGSRSTGDKDSLLSNVALLYYGEGLTQGEIAKRMQVSRATIVNMLRESRERGIVEIRVDGRHLTASTLARDLREAFGLEDVYIAVPDRRSPEPSRAVLLAQVARVGAMALLDIVEPGDRVGVAWGETIMAVSDAMPRAPIENLEVCQLIGAMISERVPASENCAIQIANKLSASCFTLHAPGIVATPELAQVFRTEPTIAAQLEKLQSLDLTIASIGNVSDQTHFRAAEMASAAELVAARRAGAAGIICCRYIDAEGQHMAASPDDRLIATDVAALRQARKRLLVVCGTDRAVATRAAIKGGLVSHLCIDQGLAEALLVT